MPQDGRRRQNIPQTRLEREDLRSVVVGTSPRREAGAADAGRRAARSTPTRDRRAAPAIDPKYRDYVGVLLNNEVWRDTLAGSPLRTAAVCCLPKCLRVEDKCPAPFDEFGLLCKHCGLCSIQDLQDEAERLGYAVLVAEGSTLVMSIIQTGKIDAIVGVSCLSVLERAFPYHGSRGDSGRGDSAAAGRLQGHHRRHRLGLGLHSPHQRRPHVAAWTSTRSAARSTPGSRPADSMRCSDRRRRDTERLAPRVADRAPANAGGRS